MPTFTVPDTPLPVGDTEFGPFTVPSGVSSILLQQDTSRLPHPDPAATLAELEIWTSPDGVQPYVKRGSTGVWGGVVEVTPKNPSGTLNTTFKPFPSPCKVKVLCHAFVAFTLTDLLVIVT